MEDALPITLGMSLFLAMLALPTYCGFKIHKLMQSHEIRVHKVLFALFLLGLVLPPALLVAAGTNGSRERYEQCRAQHKPTYVDQNGPHYDDCP